MTEKNIKRMDPEVFRGLPGLSYRVYDSFTRDLKDHWEGVERWHTIEYCYPDQSPYFRFVKPEEIKGRSHVVVPAWFKHPVDASLLAIKQAINSLTRRQGNRKPLADGGVTVLLPYAEVRMDKASVNKDNGGMNTGESILAELLADALVGASNTVTLDLHSSEAALAVRNRSKGTKLINVTAMPLFASEARENQLTGDDSRIIALDIGALQRCLRFAELTGMSPEQVVVFDKGKRDHRGKKGDIRMLYGNLTGVKKALVIDDIHDTGGSLDAVETQLKNLGFEEAHYFFTHGVFSYPAEDNVRKRSMRGFVRTMVVTDSTPQSQYTLGREAELTIIPVAGLLAWMTMAQVDHSVEELQTIPSIQNYILQPLDKVTVWKRFAKQVGADWQSVLK